MVANEEIDFKRWMKKQTGEIPINNSLNFYPSKLKFKHGTISRYNKTYIKKSLTNVFYIYMNKYSLL